MPKSTIIEREGLSDVVQQLMAAGVNTRAAMTERLRTDYNLEVSEATVGRYMARVRSAAADEAFQKITDHVNQVIPADLDALEDIERMCLDWSREAGKDVVDRVAEASLSVTRDLPEWIARLAAIGSDEKERLTLARWMIKKCLGYLAIDDRRQEQRLAAMRMAANIVEKGYSSQNLRRGKS